MVSGATSRVGETASAPASSTSALHMLVVGINEYEDSALRLGYARPDAEALAQFFERGGARLFRAVDIIRLFDRDATRGAIQRALDQLADRAQPEDLMLIYMAGHGVGIEQQFYLSPP